MVLALLLGASAAVRPLSAHADQQLWSWGANREAQLGDGGHSSRATPAPVAGEKFPAQPKVQGVAAGRYHSVAWTVDGRVSVWGHNRGSLLGLPSSIRSAPAPLSLEGIEGVRKVSASETHTLALSIDGTVSSWGLNSFGQLGVDADTDPGPHPVAGVRDAIDVAAGRAHSLAATSDGMVWAWGSNRSGQLGIGQQGGSAEPVPIDGLQNIVAVAAGGAHSVALAEDGSVWTWGAGGGGQLGGGDTKDRSQPQRVPGTGPRDHKGPADGVSPPDQPGRVAAVAAGEGFTLAIDAERRLWAWGFNYSGQLGTGDNASRSRPVLVEGQQLWSQVAAGRAHTLALDQSGNLWSWGQASKGQLGNPSDGLSPRRVETISEVTAVAAGAAHSLAIGSKAARPPSPNKPAKPSESEERPAAGTPEIDPEAARPEASAGSAPARSLSEPPVLSTGARHFVAVLADHTVIAWGDNAQGQLGNGTRRSHAEPSRVLGPDSVPLQNIVAVATGRNHTIALDRQGSVWSWGDNAQGQLGHGSTADQLRAARVPGLPRMQSIRATADRSSGEAEDGSLWVWGTSEAGSGDQTPAPDSKPKRVFP